MGAPGLRWQNRDGRNKSSLDEGKMVGRSEGEGRVRGRGHKWRDIRNYLRLKGAALLSVPSLSSRRRCPTYFSNFPFPFLLFRFAMVPFSIHLLLWHLEIFKHVENSFLYRLVVEFSCISTLSKVLCLVSSECVT